MTAEHTQGRFDLSDLVRDRMKELGLSYRRLEELCVDPQADAASDAKAEPLWKHSTLENLVKRRRVQVPDFERLRAIAAAIQVPLARVQEAAGRQFFGVDTVWSADGRVRALVEEFDELDAEDQARVLALMESRRRVQG
jgi:transcriptional regulator with XRE-family HTH domain